MFRCFIDSGKLNDDVLVLREEEAHHLLHVLRACTGDTVAVFDGRGHEATARLASVEGSSATLQVLDRFERAAPAVSLVLLQALPKAQKMDLIVQKAVELGVSEIVPTVTERTVVRLTPDQRAARCERWQRIALNAAKQCGTAWLPQIRRVMDFQEMLKESAGLDLFLVGTLETDAKPLRTALTGAKKKKPRTLGFLIGPEGDLTPDEIAAAKSEGAIAVSLGDMVLRTETAALYVMSVLRYELEVG